MDLEDSGAYYIMRFGINLYLNRRREPVKFCEVFTKGLKVLIVSDGVKFEAISFVGFLHGGPIRPQNLSKVRIHT